MKLAKVLGSVVCTRKLPELEGIKFVVIQQINSDGSKVGSPIVAVDSIGAGCGETVFFARSKEGAMTLPNPVVCADAGITGILDYYYTTKEIIE